MEIEILKRERMTPSGKAVLRMNQNFSMPILDLFVRESIQNSLDATPKDKVAEICFNTGCFSSSELSNELDDLDGYLDNRFGNGKYNYISVRDYGTEGLTGKCSPEEIEGNSYGNIYKLVYDVQKPQENPGSGGSWGIGKTVYFRMGCGLVIFYSRIINDVGEYESRLALTLIQDETEDFSLKKCPMGIAWWGNRENKNSERTVPITDENYIRHFLKIFDLREYTGLETGTTVIIPYVEYDKLLSQIQNKHGYYFEKDIEEFLLISAQRWYAPRLNNTDYGYGKYFKLKVNENELLYEGMEPVFKILQILYNCANDETRESIEFEDRILQINNTKISVRGEKTQWLEGNAKLGWFCSAKLSKDDLRMTPNRGNFFSPYAYLDIAHEKNIPIICYTRSPGMIVEYTTDISLANLDKKIQLSEDEFIIGIFKLNSDKKLVQNGSIPSTMNLLEDYFRAVERSDHANWKDINVDKSSFNPQYVTSIFAKIGRSLGNDYSSKEFSDELKNSGLRKRFSELLPPLGFGNRPTKSVQLGSGSGGVAGTALNRSKGISFEIFSDQIEYDSDFMSVPFRITTSAKNKKLNFCVALLIDSESSSVKMDEWEENMGLNTPFSIHSCSVHLECDNNGSTFKEDFSIYPDEKEKIEFDISFVPIKTERETCFGINFSMKKPKIFEIDAVLRIAVNSKDVMPIFDFKEELY